MHLIKTLLPLVASSTLVAGAAIAKPVENAIDPASTLLTLLVVDIQDVASDIKGFNQQLTGSSPIGPIVTGFTQVVETTTKTVVGLKLLQPILKVVDQQEVCKGLAAFVTVSNNLLNIVIGESTVPDFLQPGYVRPIVQLLKEAEVVAERMTAELYSHAPSCKGPTSASVKALNEQFENAICAFTPGSAMVGPLCKDTALVKRVENAADPASVLLGLLGVVVQNVNLDLGNLKRSEESTESNTVGVIVSGFTKIVDATTKTVVAMKALQPIVEVADQQPVCRALDLFTEVSAVVVNTVIAESVKAGHAINPVPLFPGQITVAEAVRAEEAAFKALVAATNIHAPDCAPGSVKPVIVQFEKAVCAFSPGSAMVGSLCKAAESV